jgi:hypothetical protein
MECILLYFLKAVLNFTLSFLRIVRLHGKLENFDNSIKYTFLITIQVGIWSMKMVHGITL